jgi:ATP-dependent helicase/nuclease subunit A
MSLPPSDHAARERARTELGTSLVLEAGAGTGKTTLLVDRIENLVRTGTARLEQIAAVTFTENAAATLKLRVRDRLERARAARSTPRAERERAAAALDVIERAQVSTIHAFCAAMLQERPLECGVTPGFRMTDEGEADALFGQAWDEWMAAALDAGRPALAAAVRMGIPLEGKAGFGEEASLRGLARTLLNQRDLEPLVSGTPPDPRAWRETLLEQADRARALLAETRDEDMLAGQLRKLADHAEGSRFLEGDALERYLLRPLRLVGRAGRKEWWRRAEALADARQLVKLVEDQRGEWERSRGSAIHADIVGELRGVVAAYERRQREAGVLDFVDLLVKARDALRTRPAVRAAFAARWPYLLVDEFQDTDPLQVQVVEELTGGRPGRLVIVGDAKQSIYRFRRAEVTLFRDAAEAARGRPGHAVLRLDQNFRSRPALLRYVNRVFSELIQESEAAAQPRYEPLVPRPDLPEGAAVVALEFPVDLDDSEKLVLRECEALAAFVGHVAAGGEQVRGEDGTPRPSRAGDVMVLAPRLSQVRHLEEALVQAGLRFTVEGGKSFFDRQEVHEVLNVLRAMDDPADRVSLVAALRSTFFGVCDTDLVAHALGGGQLGHGAPAPASSPESVREALALLSELHAARVEKSVPALLDALYDRTRVLAALGTTRRGQLQAANLEKVLHLARQGQDLGILTLRGFTRLLQGRIEDASEEPDLSSTRPGDPDTVRILSIHKAKGLEAPVVALFDVAYSSVSRPSVIPLWREGKVAIGFREGYRPPGWNGLKDADRLRAQAESRRLMYVACTRARDLLVVPCPPPGAPVGDFWKDLVDRTRSGPPDEVRVVDATRLPPADPGLDHAGYAHASQGPEATGDVAADRWATLRTARLADAGERLLTPISATRAAARTAIAAVTAPGVEGGGRSFGSLVHRLLEWTPFEAADLPALQATAAALAPSFGLDATAAPRAAEAAWRTLQLPVMGRARAAARCWRELPLVFADGADLVEGIVDLVFEEDGALVVVDYKTDGIEPGQALEQALHHAPQLQLYGRGLALATGQPVRERLVLFTSLGQAVPV